MPKITFWRNLRQGRVNNRLKSLRQSGLICRRYNNLPQQVQKLEKRRGNVPYAPAKHLQARLWL